MRLGYPCINMSLPSKFRNCRLATVEKEGLAKVKEIALHNFREVSRILDWNLDHDIYFFRISSEMVPFASHEITKGWEWWMDEDIQNITEDIKRKKANHNMRLSVHPGQYTVINSPKEEIVKRSIAELCYHQRILDLVNGDDMILHVGGVYGDKEKAKERFVEGFSLLPEEIKNTLRIENDDKSYHVKDVLDIHKKTGVSICFDFHHHRCNPYNELSLEEILAKVFQTWGKKKPKVHISSGRTCHTDTAHADYILLEDYFDALAVIGDHDVDIMFESKTKDKSVLEIRKRIKQERK